MITNLDLMDMSAEEAVNLEAELLAQWIDYNPKKWMDFLEDNNWEFAGGLWQKDSE